uniref:Pathogen-related protein n=1 Tax=Oryza brachyantha TaxID=4533 RepID=J3L3R7_ORYBR
MAGADTSAGDKYRSHLAGDGEKNTVWRHGAPPTFEAVNSLFEAERTQEWPAGSLEETVQNAIKTWEMELSHKARLEDFKSVSPGLFRLSVNGGRALTGEETLAVGSYNALLTSPILPGAGAYDAAAETFESSHDLFRAAFPRGFAWEVIRVYSGPPVITFKFRHWGHMDGPYKGHAPTGDKVEFYGVAVLKVHARLYPNLYHYDQIDHSCNFLKDSVDRLHAQVDEQLRAEDVEIN